MEINTRAVGDVYILDIRGKIIPGEGAKIMRHTILGLLENGGQKIVLNLNGVKDIDGSGIGELVRTYTLVAKAGREPIFLSMTRKLRDLLAITKLLNVFQVYKSERKAIASFA